MCDDVIHPQVMRTGIDASLRISRRAFSITLVALASAAGAASIPEKVVEKDVDITTADGVCDAVLFTPHKAGRFPAVLLWTDIFGLRPAFREMGRRLAAEGYVVLIPNAFYRSQRAPIVTGDVDLSDVESRKRLYVLRDAIGRPGLERDASTFMGYLDAQPKTDRKVKAGVQGYCMGGPFSFITAATVPDRIGAVATFHGGNALATEEATSPHLLIPKSRATFLVVQAQNDDARDPLVKERLQTAFTAAKRPAKVEVYPADHGWCVKGSSDYNEVQAERAWSELLSLYRSALV